MRSVFENFPRNDHSNAVPGNRASAPGTRAMALLGLLALAGCNSGGSGGQVSGTLGSARPDASQTEVQDLRAYCPKTVMRAGTETLNIYPDKMRRDDPDAARKLRFRATITEVVRECNYAGDFLNMKVGAAGRVVSGPAGETGQVLMPIRVAVTRGDEVLYTKLHDVIAEIPLGRPNATFAYVDDAISIPRPESENIVIYVGYDEQRVDVPGAKPANLEQPKPIN